MYTNTKNSTLIERRNPNFHGIRNELFLLANIKISKKFLLSFSLKPLEDLIPLFFRHKISVKFLIDSGPDIVDSLISIDNNDSIRSRSFSPFYSISICAAISPTMNQQVQRIRILFLYWLDLRATTFRLRYQYVNYLMFRWNALRSGTQGS